MGRWNQQEWLKRECQVKEKGDVRVTPKISFLGKQMNDGTIL